VGKFYIPAFFGFFMPRQKFSVIRGKEAKIDRMILNGKGITETAAEIGVSYNLIRDYIASSQTLWNYWLKESVDTYEPAVYPEVDKAALRKNPPTLEAMASLVEGLNSKQAVRRYLIRRGEYGVWKKNTKKSWTRHAYS
jgi:hypothetical protein